MSELSRLTEESLQALNRRQLQALAKKYDIKANMKSVVIIEALLELKAEEEAKEAEEEEVPEEPDDDGEQDEEEEEEAEQQEEADGPEEVEEDDQADQPEEVEQEVDVEGQETVEETDPASPRSVPQTPVSRSPTGSPEPPPADHQDSDIVSALVTPEPEPRPGASDDASDAGPTYAEPPSPGPDDLAYPESESEVHIDTVRRENGNPSGARITRVRVGPRVVLSDLILAPTLSRTQHIPTTPSNNAGPTFTVNRDDEGENEEDVNEITYGGMEVENDGEIEDVNENEMNSENEEGNGHDMDYEEGYEDENQDVEEDDGGQHWRQLKNTDPFAHPDLSIVREEEEEVQEGEDQNQTQRRRFPRVSTPYARRVLSTVGEEEDEDKEEGQSPAQQPGPSPTYSPESVSPQPTPANPRPDGRSRPRSITTPGFSPAIQPLIVPLPDLATLARRQQEFQALKTPFSKPSNWRPRRESPDLDSDSPPRPSGGGSDPFARGEDAPGSPYDNRFPYNTYDNDVSSLLSPPRDGQGRFSPLSTMRNQPLPEFSDILGDGDVAAIRAAVSEPFTPPRQRRPRRGRSEVWTPFQGMTLDDWSEEQRLLMRLVLRRLPDANRDEVCIGTGLWEPGQPQSQDPARALGPLRPLRGSQFDPPGLPTTREALQMLHPQLSREYLDYITSGVVETSQDEIERDPWSYGVEDIPASEHRRPSPRAPPRIVNRPLNRPGPVLGGMWAVDEHGRQIYDEDAEQSFDEEEADKENIAGDEEADKENAPPHEEADKENLPIQDEYDDDVGYYHPGAVLDVNDYAEDGGLEYVDEEEYVQGDEYAQGERYWPEDEEVYPQEGEEYVQGEDYAPEEEEYAQYGDEYMQEANENLYPEERMGAGDGDPYAQHFGENESSGQYALEDEDDQGPQEDDELPSSSSLRTLPRATSSDPPPPPRVNHVPQARRTSGGPATRPDFNSARSDQAENTPWAQKYHIRKYRRTMAEHADDLPEITTRIDDLEGMLESIQEDARHIRSKFERVIAPCYDALERNLVRNMKRNPALIDGTARMEPAMREARHAWNQRYDQGAGPSLKRKRDEEEELEEEEGLEEQEGEDF